MYALLVALFSLMPLLLVPAFLPPVVCLFLELGLVVMDPFLSPAMARFFVTPLALPLWMVDLHSVAPLGRVETQYEK